MSRTGAPELTRPAPARRHAGSTVGGPGHRLRFLLPIAPAAVLGWEVAALAVLIAYPHRHTGTGRDVTIGVLVLAVLLIGLTSLRFSGLTGAGQLRHRRALRRRMRAPESAADTAQSRLLAGLTLNNHIDRAGNRTGLVGAGLGWSAVIRVADTATPDPQLLIAAARRACLRADLPLAAAQVLTWNLPTTWAGSGWETRTLRQYFVAVRVAGATSRRAVLARGGGPAGAQRATASAIAAIAFELSRQGCPSTVLDSAELSQHVQLLAGSGATEDAQPVETRDSWSAGRMQQCCLRIPAGTPVGSALTPVVAEPLSFVVASCTLNPDRRDGVRTEYVLRAGMIGQQSALTVEQAARALIDRLRPLRYRQEQYVRATLPLALSAERR